MNFPRFCVYAFATFIFSQQEVFAQAGYVIEAPSFYGNACTGSKIPTIIESIDFTSLSILFPSLNSEIGAGTLNSRSFFKRSYCTLRFPIQLSEDFSIQKVSFDIRGFSSISGSAQNRVLSNSTLWIPQKRYIPILRKHKIQYSSRSPASEEITINYEIQSDLSKRKLSCGKKVYVDFAIALESRRFQKSAVAQIALESLDLNALTWESESIDGSNPLVQVQTAYCVN